MSIRKPQISRIRSRSVHLLKTAFLRRTPRTKSSRVLFVHGKQESRLNTVPPSLLPREAFTQIHVRRRAHSVFLDGFLRAVQLSKLVAVDLFRRVREDVARTRCGLDPSSGAYTADGQNAVPDQERLNIFFESHCP